MTLAQNVPILLRTALCVAGLAALALSSYAQAPGVKLGEPQKYLKSESISDIFSYGDDIAIAVRAYKPGSGNKRQTAELETLRLRRYDSETVALKNEVALQWDTRRSSRSLIGLDNRLLWTYTEQAENEADATIWMQFVNDDASLGDRFAAYTYNYKDVPYVDDRTARSANRSKFVSVFLEGASNQVFSKKDDAPATLTFLTFDDAKGTLLGKTTTQLTTQRNQLDILSVGISDTGEAFLLAHAFASGNKRQSRSGSDATLQLYVFAPGSEEVTQTQLRTSGMYVENASLVSGVDGQLRLFGLYAEQRGGAITGYFFAPNPASGALIKPRPFTQPQLKRMGTRITRKKAGALVMEGSFQFEDALRWTDGSFSVLLESFAFVPGSTGPNGASARPRYIFAESLVLTLSTQGELAELGVVPKYQSVLDLNAPFVSSGLVGYEGHSAVLYNDNPKNIGRDLDKRTKPLRWKDATAMMGYLDENGKLIRIPLFSRNEADKMLIAPDTGIQLRGGDMAFMANRYKLFGANQYLLGRLSAGAANRIRRRR